jgi:hypothetical protein
MTAVIGKSALALFTSAWHIQPVPKRSSTPKRPRDPNQLAKLIVDIATGQAPRDDEQPDPDADKGHGWRNV